VLHVQACVLCSTTVNTRLNCYTVTCPLCNSALDVLLHHNSIKHNRSCGVCQAAVAQAQLDCCAAVPQGVLICRHNQPNKTTASFISGC
jgi:hypothetical protein